MFEALNPLSLCCRKMFRMSLIVLLWLFAVPLRAQLIPLSSVVADGKTEYAVRLTNGDIITGTVAKIVTLTKSSKEAEDGIIVQTRMGDLTIYASEIAEITPRAKLYRHAHRIYIMPTAEPIGQNHFIGSWELVMLYGGVGIGNIVSITAGRSFVPTLAAEEQVSLINAKATVYSVDLDDSGNRGTFAVGANLTFAQAITGISSQIWNIYGAATFSGARTSITALAFTKIGEPSVYPIRARDLLNTAFRYDAGSIGVGVGLDSRLTERNDLHVIGELWNPNVTRLSNTAVLLGLRLCNTSVAMDFGLAVFTQPLVVPFVSFAWTPF
jgi:hypothetical protein